MNFVWPLVTLLGSVLWLGIYVRWGRSPAGKAEYGDVPFTISVVKGASHCGAGCPLGDLLTEWTTAAFPQVAVWFGFGSLFSERAYALWTADFAAAFLIGIAFQFCDQTDARLVGRRWPLAGAESGFCFDIRVADLNVWRNGYPAICCVSAVVRKDSSRGQP